MEGDDNVKQGRPGMLSKGGGAFFSLYSHIFRSLPRRGDRWACTARMRLGSSCGGPGVNMMEGLGLPSHFT